MEDKTPDIPKSQEQPKEGTPPRNAVERLYENFRGVPLKYLDIFIGICVAALIGVIAVGYLRSRGIL